MKTRGQSFIGGAVTLMAAAAIVKVTGALFKIPLAAVLGGEGMGYFMTAYSVMGPMYALSAAGFPVAVSKLTAAAAAKGRFGDRKRIFTSALIMFPLIGAVLFMIVFAAAPYFAAAINNAPAAKAVRAIAPAVLFCCITSVFRGYYEGGRNMVPTALSQVAEAFTKLFAGLFLSSRCITAGLESFESSKTVFGQAVLTRQQAIEALSPYAAAAAVSGVAISTSVGCVVMALYHLLDERVEASGQRGITSAEAASMLMRTAAPVCAGALVINMSSLVDLVSVMSRISFAAAKNWNILCQSHPDAALDALSAERAANFLYGSYTGIAMTVFNIVPALTASLGICALPMIAALSASGSRAQLRMRIGAVLRITIMLAMPMGMGISFMAHPMLAAVFSHNPLETAVAARLLRPLGAAAVLVAVSGAANSMLQAVGRVYVPVKLLLGGAAIKLGVNWLLIARPEINILGAPWGTLACYVFITLSSVGILNETVGGGVRLAPMLLKPFAASLLCCFGAAAANTLLCGYLGVRAALVISVFFGSLIYAITLLLIDRDCAEDLFFLKNSLKIKKQ